MSPDGDQGIEVYPLEEPSSLVWSSPGEASWSWRLDARPVGTPRLITRIRSRMRPNPRSIAFDRVVELADIWMIRNMFLNLRERAERPRDRTGGSTLVALDVTDRGRAPRSSPGTGRAATTP